MNTPTGRVTSSPVVFERAVVPIEKCRTGGVSEGGMGKLRSSDVEPDSLSKNNVAIASAAGPANQRTRG